MLKDLFSPLLANNEDVVPEPYPASEHEHALTNIWSLVHTIWVVSGGCRSGKRPPPHTCPSKEEDVEKYRRRIPTIHNPHPRSHMCICLQIGGRLASGRCPTLTFMQALRTAGSIPWGNGVT